MLTAGKGEISPQKSKGKKMPAQLVHLNECRQASHAERLAQAMRMRADGASLSEIAKTLNVSVPTARQYWREALAMVQDATADSAEEYRKVLIIQAEELIAKWSPLANAPHVEGAAQAAAIVSRYSEHIARLLGLDKIPPAVATATGPTIDITEALKSPATRDALKRMIAEAEGGA